MDRYDVEDFGRKLVIALADSGSVENGVQAVDEFERFITTMDKRGYIDPLYDDDDEDDDDFDDDM